MTIGKGLCSVGREDILELHAGKSKDGECGPHGCLNILVKQGSAALVG